MTLRIGENNFIFDDSVTPPRMVGFKQANGDETFFNLSDAQPAGAFGAFSESEILAAGAVALTTVTNADVATLALAAGTYLCWGELSYVANAATTMTNVQGWIHTVSATIPTRPNKGAYAYEDAVPTGSNRRLFIGQRRITLAAAASIYLTARSSFGVNSLSAYGYLAALRVG